MPKGFFNDNLLNNKLTLKKKAMQALILSTSATQKDISQTILKVTAIYQNKVDILLDEGLPKVDAKLLAKNGEKLLQQRIESLVVFSEVQKIKEENAGEYYRWLPSGADEPDPEHQLLYGQKFLVGDGDSGGNMPGERYGCQCGMEILTSFNKND